MSANSLRAIINGTQVAIIAVTIRPHVASGLCAVLLRHAAAVAITIAICVPALLLGVLVHGAIAVLVGAIAVVLLIRVDGRVVIVAVGLFGPTVVVLVQW